MFNSSLRRVARSCPNAALPTRPGTPSHTPITASFTTHCHQRRHSSSKPPVPPNNGSPTIPASSVKQVGAPRSDKRPTTDSRLAKRKTAKGDRPEAVKQQEDASNEWTRSLPSVPSTQHLNPKDIYVASFFSTHRPISITGPLPPETQIADIDKIFQTRPKSSRKKSQEVIYTINTAVQNLDDQISNQHPGSQHEEAVAQRADLIKALAQYNNTATNSEANQAQQVDGQPPTSVRVPGNVRLVIQEFARRFRPFNVPPAPEAVPNIELIPSEDNLSQELVAEHSNEAAASEDLQAQQLEVEITNQDMEPQIQHIIIPSNSSQAPTTTKSNFFTSHVPRRTSTTKGGRVGRGVYLAKDLRKMRMPSALKRPHEMYLISVKRQRALKMKKHKHKKLLRKTRNLRRRQGKI